MASPSPSSSSGAPGTGPGPAPSSASQRPSLAAASPFALSLHIPKPEMNSSTPEGSPRVFALAKSLSERLATLSPRSAPGAPTAAGSPHKGHSTGTATPGSSAATPRAKTILQRFQTASPRATTPILRSPSSFRTSMGATWTRAIVDLYHAQEPEEVVTALGEVRSLLRMQQGKREHLKFCKKDLQSALNEKKRKLPAVFTPEAQQLVLDVLAEFFDEDRVNKLPSALLIQIATFLPTPQLGGLSAVCKAWNETLAADGVWKPLYIHRFHFLDPREAVGVRPFKQLFRERLLDPHVGDLVEVAWKGKFRLESLDIYQGLAWWSAIVVDKDKADGSRYKIHYPGWDSRWDEWVHRDRLRWTVEQDLNLRIGPNDDVEIWCCGSNVPGAWLEAKVRKVKGSKYCVGRVASGAAGPLWVERDRVRMSPKGARNLGKRSDAHGGSFFGRDAAAVVSNCSIM